MSAPTARQLDVLCALGASIKTRGYAPTMRELGDLLSIVSTNCVHGHLQALTRLGLIERDRYTSRGLRITAAGHALLNPQRAPKPFRAERSVERLDFGA